MSEWNRNNFYCPNISCVLSINGNLTRQNREMKRNWQLSLSSSGIFILRFYLGGLKQNKLIIFSSFLGRSMTGTFWRCWRNIYSPCSLHAVKYFLVGKLVLVNLVDFEQNEHNSSPSPSVLLLANTRSWCTQHQYTIIHNITDLSQDMRQLEGLDSGQTMFLELQRHWLIGSDEKTGL